MFNGEGQPDRDCGKVARITVNGFPCCSQHFDEYESEDLVEAVGLLPSPPEPDATAACAMACMELVA